MTIPVRTLRHAHAIATLTWLALTIPTLIWWRDSVPWLATMSVWANVASHFSAWQGARAEDAAS